MYAGTPLAAISRDISRTVPEPLQNKRPNWARDCAGVVYKKIPDKQDFALKLNVMPWN